MRLNYKTVSIAIAALVALSVIASVTSIAPKATAQKEAGITVTASSDTGVLSGAVSNRAKIELAAGTVNSVTLTAMEIGTWRVTSPSGASSISLPRQDTTISTPYSGVYTVDFTLEGSNKPNWSATITIL